MPLFIPRGICFMAAFIFRALNIDYRLKLIFGLAGFKAAELNGNVTLPISTNKVRRFIDVHCSVEGEVNALVSQCQIMAKIFTALAFYFGEDRISYAFERSNYKFIFKTNGYSDLESYSAAFSVKLKERQEKQKRGSSSGDAGGAADRV
ncbi:hypothetical protein Tco_0259920 [Tanacetum coccineum]